MINGEKLMYMDTQKKCGTTVTAAELQGLKTGAVEMLIAKMLPTKASTLLPADPKSGKSTLAMTIWPRRCDGTGLFSESIRHGRRMFFTGFLTTGTRSALVESRMQSQARAHGRT